jgi:hypothetical protein
MEDAKIESTGVKQAPVMAHKEDANNGMMQFVREIAKEHPVVAAIIAVAMGLGFPTGLGFFGAQSGAQSVIDRVQDHEVRITGAERDIVELKATSKEHRDMMRDIREHMIIQTEHVKVIQRDLAEIKAQK